MAFALYNANTGRADRGRGRGGARRGGRGRDPSATSRGSKPLRARVGPTRVLEDTEWVEDPLLRDGFIVILCSKGGTQQVTFHHPIGETQLDKNSWVATPSNEVHFLLSRRKSEALSRWEREKEQAVRTAVLASRTGRKLNDATPPVEVWVFDGAPPIGVTIAAGMAAAKAAERPESEWVNHTTEAVRASELAFKQALRVTAVPAGWVADHPQPTHETRGGPLADRAQVAVGYLAGCTASAALDKVQRRAYGVDA